MWLVERKTSIIAIVISSSFGGAGFGTLVVYASIKAIPQSVIEAAEVDGANRRQMNFRIVLPLIMESIVFVFCLAIIGAMQIWGIIYIMQPPREAYSFAYDIYATGYVDSEHGLAFAKNIFLVAGILAIVFAMRRSRRALSY